LEDCVVEGAAVCCLAEESPSYYEIKGAIASGTITSVKDGTGGSHLIGVRLGQVLSFDFSRLPDAR
jgi:hypothetical protein